MQTALLFERDDAEEVDDWPPDIQGLGRSSILWIDLERLEDGQLDELREALALTPETREQLADGVERPYLSDYRDYVHVTALAPSRNDGNAALVKVDCLVAPRWVVTLHEEPVRRAIERRASPRHPIRTRGCSRQSSREAGSSAGANPPSRAPTSSRARGTPPPT